jgi:transposase
MCHTLRSAVGSAEDGSGAWRCTRCGQQWDADRVLAVAAYAVWSREHDRARDGAAKPSTSGSATEVLERTP